MNNEYMNYCLNLCELEYQSDIGCDAPGTAIFDVPLRFVLPEYIPIPNAPIPVGDAFD